jgi:hypothetical protein
LGGPNERPVKGKPVPFDPAVLRDWYTQYAIADALLGRFADPFVSVRPIARRCGRTAPTHHMLVLDMTREALTRIARLVSPDLGDDVTQSQLSSIFCSFEGRLTFLEARCAASNKLGDDYDHSPLVQSDLEDVYDELIVEFALADRELSHRWQRVETSESDVPLQPIDKAILRELVDAGVVMLQVDLQTALDDCDVPSSRRTIAKRVAYLRKKELVSAPQGRSKGLVITAKGRAILNK